MRVLRIVLVASCLIAVPAAAQDTTVVRADNPPEWGSPPTLVEELRIGGLAEAHSSFGRIAGVVVDSHGVMWVADGLAAEVKRFSTDGEFIDVVGGRGEGPGEFQGISGIKRMPDGRVVVWDAHGGASASSQRTDRSPVPLVG